MWYRCITFLLNRTAFALWTFRWTNLDIIIIIASLFTRLISCIGAAFFFRFRIVILFRFTLWARFTLQRKKYTKEFIYFLFDCNWIESLFITFDSFLASSFECSALLGELNATLLLDNFERLSVEWLLLLLFLFEFNSIKDWDRLFRFKLLRRKHFWLNSWKI